MVAPKRLQNQLLIYQQNFKKSKVACFASVIRQSPFLEHLWSLTDDGKLVNRAGIEIFPNKVWNIPNEGDEGYIEEQATKEVLGFEDKRSGELKTR